MYLQIRNITKRYGDLVAVDNVTVDVGREEFVCLLGPSGCGKTTLLRMVSGLIEPDEGQILLDGNDVRPIPARNRGFGIVFQSYSLFPNMTVAQNVGYGLKIRNWARSRIEERVAELLSLVGLESIGEKHPHQISGGQQQRIALARAIAIDPALLLLDEPLSALDAKVRVALRGEVRALQRRLGIPTLMVTHDQEEAMAMADRIVCMNAGRVEQVGTPTELYNEPETRFVATFLGRMNVLEFTGTPVMGGSELHTTGTLEKDVAELYIRPEHIRLLAPGSETPDENRFGATVTETVFQGNVTSYRVEVDGYSLEVETLGRPEYENGQTVMVSIPARAVRAIG